MDATARRWLLSVKVAGAAHFVAAASFGMSLLLMTQRSLFALSAQMGEAAMTAYVLSAIVFVTVFIVAVLQSPKQARRAVVRDLWWFIAAQLAFTFQAGAAALLISRVK